MRQKNKGLIMCVLCFNSQWRSVVIGSVSTGLSLLILLTSLAYHSQVSLHLATKVQEQKCYQSEDVYVKRTNPSGSGNRSNECVFLAFSTLYPWPLWIILGLYILLSINLVISAVYKWIPGVIFYLATDAMFIGLMATALCMSFFPKGVTRIALLTLLFPCLSLALCAWMTVFGFYLRLEDIAKRAEKRKSAQRAIQRGINTSLEKPTEFVNLAFDQHETT